MRAAVLALAGFAITTLAEIQTVTLPCADETTNEMLTGNGPPELANQTLCNPYGTYSYLMGKTSSTSTLSPTVVTETVLATPTVALPTCDADGKCVFPPSCVVSFPGFISCTGDGSTAAATNWEFASSSTVEERNTTTTSTSSAVTPSFTMVIPTNPHDIVLLPNGSPDPQPWTTLFAASSAATTSMSASFSASSSISTGPHSITTPLPPADATSNLYAWTTLYSGTQPRTTYFGPGGPKSSSDPNVSAEEHSTTTAIGPPATATPDPQPWTSIFTAGGPRGGPGFLGHNPAGHAKRQVNAISIFNEALSAMESAMPYLTTTTTVQTNTFTVLANTTLPCLTSAPYAGSGYPASSTANVSGVIITNPLRPGWSSIITGLSTLNPHINNTSIDSGTYLNVSTFVATQSSTSQNLASTTDSSAIRSTVTSTKVIQPSTTETDASKTDFLGFTAAATSNIGNTSSGALALAAVPGFGNVVGAGVAMAGLCFGAVLLL
ncbi:hypothetical protein LTR56_011318 [Elasticomyces elasticus]|nr:hypothetical protein LTR56_011318 [Elasticomyces elasticus]KAK3668390.1 hypothetical protein LTR22_000682 [Elasticomyces elasticus]KAK4930920.1 hypothetical protein LTR49_002686 [Elasticomyces elasticus]KAK5758668.1 hypothetical protein LTS12_011214 [Elasticomyces elasticus]